MWHRVRCVILNSTYEPITIVPVKKALLHIIKGTATMLEAHPTYTIGSAKQTWNIPVQIILKRFVKVRPAFRTPALLKSRHLFARDRYTCQYCKRHKKNLHVHEALTIDHVNPRDLGGRHIWENVVTACSTCNNKKANKTLQDLGWKLDKKPYTPTMFEIWSKTVTKYLDSV